MMKKPTGLAAFTSRRAAPATAAAPASEPVSVEPKVPPGRRVRAQGATVALTVRVSKSDWLRLHQLAMAEGTSLQVLALRGFSRLLEEQGLPSVEM